MITSAQVNALFPLSVPHIQVPVVAPQYHSYYHSVSFSAWFLLNAEHRQTCVRICAAPTYCSCNYKEGSPCDYMC